MRLLIIFSMLFVGSFAHAGGLVVFKAVGESPKGQFVAFEEYGYKNGTKIPYSKIRVMNMWQNKYVSKPIIVTGLKHRVDMTLGHVRAKVRELVDQKLKKYSIKIN